MRLLKEAGDENSSMTVDQRRQKEDMLWMFYKL